MGSNFKSVERKIPILEFSCEKNPYVKKIL